MKSLYFLIALLVAMCVTAQKSEDHCGSDIIHLKLLKESPQYKRNFEKNTADWQEYAPKHSEDWAPKKERRNGEETQTPPTVITLSVVFHDVSASNTFLLPSTASLTEYEYIVNNLNLIYKGQNVNGNTNQGNNTYIKFCLATQNIRGDTYTVASTQKPNISAAGNLDADNASQHTTIANQCSTNYNFVTTKYINIYIVDNIVDPVAGFASSPSSHGTISDGIFIERKWLTNTSSTSNTDMNVLAHEMGHYLGLIHTFGTCPASIINDLTDPVTGYNPCSCNNDNCLFYGDMVCDTPPAMYIPTWAPITNLPNSCNTDAHPYISPVTVTNVNPLTTDLADPKDNYMDYGIDIYQRKFTFGQIARMQFMIDPSVGPRKSLLGQSICEDCIAMTSCNFTVTPNAAFVDLHPNETPHRYEISQVAGLTPIVPITVTTLCTASFNYTWTLLNLETNTTLPPGTGSTYTTTAGLIPGNYQITFKATLTSNSQCFEYVVFNFTVNPTPGNCELYVPTANNLSAWATANWKRMFFTGGWFNNINSYPVNSQHFDNTDTTGGFDAGGYDVIALAPNNSIGISNDSLLGNYILPGDANISQVIRVGRKDNNGGGKAYYAKKTITINKNNCRFKVWILGATTGQRSNTQFPFQQITSSQNDAAFGFINKYEYCSAVNNSTANTLNSTLGGDDTLNASSTIVTNTLISQLYGLSYPSSYATSGIYTITNGWQSMILDYSEFVNLNSDTKVTLTFFAHSNIAEPAIQNAYAYYGIECLGGGIPRDYVLDIPDVSTACGSPSNASCATFTLPTLPYYFNTSNVGPYAHGQSGFNFDNFNVYKIDPVTGDPSPTPMPISWGTTYPLELTEFKICLDQSDAPFQDFRLVYTTLHETIIDTFRIYVNFYNSIPDCTEGDQRDLAYYPDGIINGDILLCGTNNLPILHLTNTCIAVDYEYQWAIKVGINWMDIPGANSASLQLTNNPSSDSLTADNNYEPESCVVTYMRKTKYKEPYCGNPKEKFSEVFNVYNKQILYLRYYGTQENDICFGDTYSIDLLSPSLGDNAGPYPGCSLPAHFVSEYASTANHLSFQLFDPATNQPFGNIINYNFNGVYTNNGAAIPNLNMHFTFDNINPSTGAPLFVPTESVVNFPYNIRITGDYLGCPLEETQHNYALNDINYSLSAVGGKIGYDCVDFEYIYSIDDGVTYPTGEYAWEFSTDNVTFYPIVGAPNTSFLPLSFVDNLSITNPILYIRRKSFGTGQCLDPHYSNSIIITNHPGNVLFNPSDLPDIICKGASAPILPTTSSNGIMGTWNPTTCSNQVSATYTFTPFEGYCLPNYTYNLTVNDVVLPNFTSIGPFCAGTNFVLPSTAPNGVTGSWTPAVNTMATTSYVFTASTSSTNTCPVTFNMTVVVNPVSTVSFANSHLFDPICVGNPVPVLPATDINGVEGEWSPAVVSNAFSNDYTFTPTNPCIPAVTYTISVIQQCGITIGWGSEVSCQAAVTGSRYEEDIVDGPCLRVCENSTIKYELHGATSLINHTDWNITGGTLLTSTSTSCEVQWNNSSFCALQGVIYLNNGTQLFINKCIEKLEAPLASFSVYPFATSNSYTTCAGLPTFFENHTVANNGDDNLYYNWYFSDGSTSNEFEPSHIFSKPGIYHVTLVVSNGCSCVSKIDAEIIVEEGNIKIECPSVVCEGQRATYKIDSGYETCPDLHWQVDGGTILSYQNNNTQIAVAWNNVGADGFGYVMVNTPSCDHCTSKVKIPVVTQSGIIKGDLFVCEKTQNLYSLPQWPSTTFNWDLEDNGGTGALLFLSNQRNEIILNSSAAGILKLKCTYFNTLLGCGGTASLTIHVQSSVVIHGASQICATTTTDYEIQDNNGVPVPNVSWNITGPNLFEQNGMTNPIGITFPSAGVYYISTSDPNHCSLNHFEVRVQQQPAAPTAINGPLVVCPGTPVTYSCSPPAGATAHWSVISGTIMGSSVGNSIVVNFNPASTSYSVQVYYVQDNCTSPTLTQTIQRDIPNLTVITSSPTVCGSTYADYAINNVHADNYDWVIAPATAGSIVSGQNTSAIHVLWNQQAQNATITLQLRKCGIVYNITPIQVHIISSPNVLINVTSAPICSGSSETFTFSLSPAGAFTDVVWDFGDGTNPVTITSPTTTVHHMYQTHTDSTVNYTVTATVSNASGCLNAVGTTTIIVSPAPIIAISPLADVNLCNEDNDPSSFTYSVNIQGGFAATNEICWYKDGVLHHCGSGLAAATINVQTLGVGTYYATVKNDFGCIATTRTFHVTNDCLTGSCPTYGVDAVAYTNIGCQHVKVVPTLLPAGFTSVSWVGNLPGATILNSDENYFEAENVEPGEYELKMKAYYNDGNTTCVASKTIPFIIPYKADLKYKVVCGAGNMYSVTIYDYSSYFPGTPIAYNQYLFTYDDGAHWYSGTVPNANGIHQFTISLPAGSHQIGIKIGSLIYPSCQKIITLNLPAKPTANFTLPQEACIGTPIALIPSNPVNPNYSYWWSFNNNQTHNTQPTPTITPNLGTQGITLTVTDQYGCTATTNPPKFVNVNNLSIDGNLFITPTTSVCEGGQIILHFNSTGILVPTLYNWYLNTPAHTLIASGPSASIPVTQNGSYQVYPQNVKGCIKTNVPAINVTFIPTPEAPKITGNAIACTNSVISLSVPVNTSVIYEWSRNGILQPAWNNLNAITDVQAVAGIYTYSVTAKVPSSSSYCTSTPGILAVNVVAAPAVPVLSMETVTCTPYQVAVTVNNVEANVGYYWSNGGLGASTVMTHDGPLQVRAVINECVTKAQLDLPTDLESLAWTFPAGCYTRCANDEGFITGPLGEFSHWIWGANNHALQHGDANIPPLHHLGNANYTLTIDSGTCEKTFGTLSNKVTDCKLCDIRFEINKVECATFGNQSVYQTTLEISNPYAAPAWITFTAAGAEGYFSTNSLLAPVGISTQTLYFNGIVGFNGGPVIINVDSDRDGVPCQSQFTIDFPTDCKHIEDCHFNYKFEKPTCVKTDFGYIYHFTVEVTNPYSLNAVTAVSIPASFGTILPSNVVSPSGVLQHDFYFYPTVGFSGGAVPLTLTSSIGSVSCLKNFELDFPKECSEVKKCDFEFEKVSLDCLLLPNGQYGYRVTMVAYNPYGTNATITLSAPNGEGNFVPGMLNVPAGPSAQTYDFYPANGFTGGTITFNVEGHYKDQICLSDQHMEFPLLCCPTCRTVDLNDPKVTAANLLVVAPNPAKESSTIFYNFVKASGHKTIVMTDLLGRTLQVWEPSENKGSITIDCSRYAQGQYLIIMKQNDEQLKNTKFIKG